jgi:hypothetical protein
MNDDELRMLIRAAIQRHMSAPTPLAPAEPRRDAALGASQSVSFGQYRIDRPVGETMCIIEENVQCNHCGFCKCHGH